MIDYFREDCWSSDCHSISMAWSYHGSFNPDCCYVGSKKKMFKVGCEFINQMKGEGQELTREEVQLF